MRDDADDRRDRVSFRWAGGPEVTLGRPTVLTSYAVCVYDDDGGSPRLVAEGLAPGRSQCGTRACWTEVFPAGSHFANTVRYVNRERVPDGLRSLAVRGDPGRAVVQQHGPALPLLAPPPYTLPVTAQVVDTAGTCMTGAFGGLDVKLNTAPPGKPAVFRAVGVP